MRARLLPSPSRNTGSRRARDGLIRSPSPCQRVSEPFAGLALGSAAPALGRALRRASATRCSRTWASAGAGRRRRRAARPHRSRPPRCSPRRTARRCRAWPRITGAARSRAQDLRVFHAWVHCEPPGPDVKQLETHKSEPGEEGRTRVSLCSPAGLRPASLDGVLPSRREWPLAAGVWLAHVRSLPLPPIGRGSWRGYACACAPSVRNASVRCASVHRTHLLLMLLRLRAGVRERRASRRDRRPRRWLLRWRRQRRLLASDTRTLPSPCREAQGAGRCAGEERAACPVRKVYDTVQVSCKVRLGRQGPLDAPSLLPDGSLRAPASRGGHLSWDWDRPGWGWKQRAHLLVGHKAVRNLARPPVDRRPAVDGRALSGGSEAGLRAGVCGVRLCSGCGLQQFVEGGGDGSAGSGSGGDALRGTLQALL